MSAISAIVLAAGRGERFRSRLPKVLHLVAGDPMLFYVLSAADSLSCNPIVCVLGYGEEKIRAALEERRFRTKGRLLFGHQRRQLGTADAAGIAKKSLARFKGDILILCGDVPLICKETLGEFAGYHQKGGYGLSIMTALLDDPEGYGRVVRDGSGLVIGIVEESNADPDTMEIQEINAGIYLVSSKILFSYLPLIRKNPGKGEFYLTDLVGIAASRGEKVGAFCVEDSQEVMGVNTQGQLLEANYLERSQINNRWMERGVRFVDAGSAHIDREVRLAPDVVVGSGCVLRGKTVVKSGASIDTGAVLIDTWVGCEAKIKPYSVLEGSRVESKGEVGPFAHLRPGSVVGRGAKVGNFVEMKKTRLGKGARANHLSYLGDAAIGEGSNIGAGTITCNYDGFAKHRTVIGPRSFIGSDTQLVAPVRLGTGSWIGAGSTITKNVPSGALALSRAEQVNIRGWIKHVRNRRLHRK